MHRATPAWGEGERHPLVETVDTLGGVLPLHPHLRSREVPQAAAPRSDTSWCHEGSRGRPSLHWNPKHTHSSTLHTSALCPAHLTQSPASHRRLLLQSCKFKSKADGLHVPDGENSSGDSARERVRDKAAPPTGSAVSFLRDRARLPASLTYQKQLFKLRVRSLDVGQGQEVA